MTATPAQIANDLDAQSRIWAREENWSRTMAMGAALIRLLEKGEKIDWRRYGPAYRRLKAMEARSSRLSDQLLNSVSRGCRTIEILRMSQ